MATTKYSNYCVYIEVLSCHSNHYINSSTIIGASRSEPHTTEFYAFLGIIIIGASAAKPHMDDKSAIFHIYIP